MPVVRFVRHPRRVPIPIVPPGVWEISHPALRCPGPMSKQTEENAPASQTAADETLNPIREALLEVVRTSVQQLPDEATLGELYEGIEQQPELRPVLEVLTVQHLLEWGKSRPRRARVEAAPTPEDEGVYIDEDGNYNTDMMDGAAAVVRRKADVDEGNLAVLRFLAKAGAHTELSISRGTRLGGEQVRLVVRHLRNKGLVHAEGSGAKRRNRITRAGNQYLKKQGAAPAEA